MVSAADARSLATATGMSPEVLISTLDGHNAAATTGTTRELPVPNTNTACERIDHDLLAIPVVPGVTFTMGGLLINPDGRVLDVDERPIHGLLAAGATAGGLQGSPTGGYIGGLSPALVQGYVAGATASGQNQRLGMAAEPVPAD